ncbi:type II secretion system major pseudopilin GspG [Colwellia sp. E2M01]|uniref:type II secretion system major pseudopilin GspG n=1 Tax=Colwellia sp. E2M01 TaxID=2841561 RepID=UPI001C0A3877|nr:type II secretion system major pseudopilin GspG [Colwellia sp. E2M01]MBU2869352.1 type II secretion system major pseudopilin GspG [Colwellia sp. E2M01]
MLSENKVKPILACGLTRKNKSGFTLVELLIVMVILGLLASLVAPKMFGKIGSSKQGTAKTQMELFSTSLDMYRLDLGNYPATLDELRSSDKANWQGPYLPKDIPNDPWGNSYIYKFPGDNGEYDLISYGSDGKEGGTDEASDISY